MTGLWIITVPLLAIVVMNIAVTRYWNRQTGRILAGLPEDPKPWYVRLFDKVLP
jgi:hypothetical protein